MPQPPAIQRFLETTRGRILALLRCSPRTVEELATALELTDNAVRAHLATLERDGLARSLGVRRSAGAGKPSTVYDLAAGADVVFSNAYPTVLAALVEELAQRFSAEDAQNVLSGLGRRLAEPHRLPAGASREEKLRAAVKLLNNLGGSAELVAREGVAVIQGCGCPLSSAVAARPETCRAVEALLSDIVGTSVRQRCRQGDRPSCCFEVDSHLS
ncbi:MAG TPA: ArsR family transcriptional regulator [Gemmatimonadales bacterium]|nr:ArsR family transcriptional regulator [Gemmatimonadales bacterium]